MMVHNCILLLSIIILCMVGNSPVSSFAAWMKCYHKLDPEEVIMNHYVVPAENADKSHVQIRVMDEEKVHSLLPTRENENDGIVYEYDDTSTMNNNNDETMKGIHLFQIGIDISEDEKLRDIQFVVDILTDGARFVKKKMDHTSNSPTPSYPRSKKTPIIQCKGKRGVGKHRDTLITIELDGSVPEVEIVAGWACEREAVTMTKRVIFKPQRLSTPIDDETEEL